MRRLLIAGNWKMNGSRAMTNALISGIEEGLGARAFQRQFDVLVCPPSAYLSEAQASISGAIKLGAQNVNAEPNGAHTGEIALPMLQEFDCSYVLLGHSERRELYAESNRAVANKFTAVVEFNRNSDIAVIPVLCIGETLQQRQSDETESVLAAQLDAVLEQVGITDLNQAVIAYEPVWAIGTGETASPEQAQQAHAFVRNKLADLDAGIADRIQILYGGSMKAENAFNLLSQTDIDGGLIGGASLQAESFLGICDAALQVVNTQ